MLKLALQQAVKLAEAGRIDESIAAYEAILRREPESLMALHGLSLLLISKDRFTQAYAIARELTDQIAHVPEAWTLRALSARGLGLMDDALAAAQQSVRLRPDPAMVSCVGVLQFHLGKIAEAIETFDRAIAMSPEDDSIRSNRLFALTCLPGIARDHLVREHLEWGNQLEARYQSKQVQPPAPFANSRDPDRRLRIGYVSADLRVHPVAALLEPILREHDRSVLEITCYDNHGGTEDAVTKRLRTLVDRWVKCARLNDQAMAAQIRNDEIDVLVDLSGHTAGNRLPVFALRPAPVQVSWFGYMSTTGLKSVDYRLADPNLCPAGSEANYAETIYRLPTAVAWAPEAGSPDPGPPPLRANGRVTFGSFNNWSKVSDDVIGVWARILMGCERSILRIIAAGGDTEVVRHAIEHRFLAHGIPGDRLSISGTTSLKGFLEIVKQADIALDPFPYNGGTTSFHCFWMGVPIVSLSSHEEIGRAGQGILSSVGLADLCASTRDDYVAIAIKLSQDTARLAGLRSILRESLSRTAVMNAANVTREVEKAYRAMWHNWLEGKRSRLGVSV